MVYAWLVLHAREPQFFKTAAVPSRPPPMGLCGNVLGVVGSGGWRSQSSFPAFACKKAGDIRTSMPGTRALDSSSSSPRFPYCSALLRYSTPCTILLPLLCHRYCIYSLTDHRRKQHHLSAHQQHLHYPTLTCPPQQRAATRHAIVQRIQVLPRVCRFRASHQAPDEKTARLISHCPLSVIDTETIIQPPP